MVIYKIENQINHKVYIGQTNDFEKRMRGHKSVAFNKKANNYKLHLYQAIRKYGWDNFTKEIIEEISDKESQEYVDERERYYIEFYDSTNRGKGYNIDLGGQNGAKKQKLTFEQKVAMSNLFTLDEVIDIQNLLIKGIARKEILEKYSPKLTESLLDNINVGANFKNDKLIYPLFDYLHSNYSVNFTREEQRLIQQDLIDGKLIYKEIAKKWKIKSLGLISLINNGKIWKNEELEYPLSSRNFSRLHNFRTWVKPVQKDLIESKLTIKQIAEKYNKSPETIKKINKGDSYHNNNYIYPLTSNRKK